MIDTWSSLVLAKIFIIDGVAVSFTLNTATFRRRCFQANKALRKSEHLVLVTVYLKILNACKTIVVKIAILLYICTQTISIQIVFGHNLYDINQILICFLRSQLISNSFLRATESYLELWVGCFNYPSHQFWRP